MIAERAEDLGHASLWTSEHILLPTSDSEPFGNLLETFTTLTWSRIRLGTAILVLPQRDPLLVAKQAATLHHLSSGLTPTTPSPSRPSADGPPTPPKRRRCGKPPTRRSTTHCPNKGDATYHQPHHSLW
jgi:luciferase-like monooxygenase